MTENYKHLNKYEIKIIKLLYYLKNQVSTREISGHLKLHWATTKKNLRDLEYKGVVKKNLLSNKTMWELNPIFADI